MRLTNNLTQRQKREYAATCERIREEFGSYHKIALAIYSLADDPITGESVRTWMQTQTIPTNYCFYLYELMQRNINITTLLPWLKDFVEDIRREVS
jgi:hypothetical protein